jgi:hypothetical protein
VSASFDAFAEDEASFDWVTAPSSPGLSTRTEMFWFEGFTWVALDPAIAAWLVSADCVAAWTGTESSANAVVELAARTARATMSATKNRLICVVLLWIR